MKSNMAKEFFEDAKDREEIRLVLKNEMNNFIPEHIQDKILWEEREINDKYIL